VFLVYCALAITWSDFPFVAFKRWIKTLGQPIMVLIILTEPDRLEALRRVMKRTALLLMPLSILFIKYYPQLGRSFDPWNGLLMNQGVMSSKNGLGLTCLVFGLFFFWNLLTARRFEDRRQRTEEIGFSLFCLWMVWWLLSAANSATSLACLVIGAGTMLLLGSRFVSKRHFGAYVVAGLLLAALAEVTFGVYAMVLNVLGRDPTLTTRTEMWADLLSIPINPLIGVGFESFWLGERLDYIWSLWEFHPNQAHNGYLETYLNLGWIGVVLLLVMILSAYRKARAELLRDFDFGRLKMSVLFAVIAFNYTEAAFRGLHFIWTMFFLISIDYAYQASRQRAAAFPLIRGRQPDWNRTLVPAKGDPPEHARRPPAGPLRIPSVNRAWRGPARFAARMSSRARATAIKQ
jgi:O-antigen ligase